MSARRRLLRSTCGLAALALAWTGMAALGGTAGATQHASPDHDDDETPAAHASVAQWQAWAEHDLDQARRYDWAADSEARGCTLVEIEFSTEVDPGYNAAMGAPAGLSTVRVDRVEECEEPTAQMKAMTSIQARTASVPRGTRCNYGTRGPGTICLSSSGSWITASWQNRGSAATTGFLRIYRIPTNATHCPTGTTWHTGAQTTWSSGQTRSISKAQTQNGAYSAHIWRKNVVGHSNWGGTCARF